MTKILCALLGLMCPPKEPPVLRGTIMIQPYPQDFQDASKLGPCGTKRAFNSEPISATVGQKSIWRWALENCKQ